MTARSHLQKYPRARSSTIALLTVRDEKTAQLNAENEAARIPKTHRGRLQYYADKLMALSVAWVKGKS